jgi:hypothetical protein
MTYVIIFDLLSNANLASIFDPFGKYKSINAQKIPQFLGGLQFKTQFMNAYSKKP